MTRDIKEMIDELSDEAEPLQAVLNALLQRIQILEATVKDLEARIHTPIKMGR